MIANDSVKLNDDDGYYNHDLAKNTRYGALLFVLMKLKVVNKHAALEIMVTYNSRKLILQSKRDYYRYAKYYRNNEIRKQIHDLPPRKIKPTKARI